MTYFRVVGNAAEPLGAIFWAAAPRPAKARDTLGLEEDARHAAV